MACTGTYLGECCQSLEGMLFQIVLVRIDRNFSPLATLAAADTTLAEAMAILAATEFLGEWSSVVEIQFSQQGLRSELVTRLPGRFIGQTKAWQYTNVNGSWPARVPDYSIASMSSLSLIVQKVKVMAPRYLTTVYKVNGVYTECDRLDEAAGTYEVTLTPKGTPMSGVPPIVAALTSMTFEAEHWALWNPSFQPSCNV